MSFLKIALVFYSIPLRASLSSGSSRNTSMSVCVCLCTAGPTRSSSWRATLPGPSACPWPTWWKASQRTYTKCTPCPRWSRWGHEEAPPLFHGQPGVRDAHDRLLSPFRACTEWRTRSSWASPPSWVTTAWPTWSTWRWSPKRRSSWWRAPRPCGASRKSSLCEEHACDRPPPQVRPERPIVTHVLALPPSLSLYVRSYLKGSPSGADVEFKPLLKPSITKFVTHILTFSMFGEREDVCCLQRKRKAFTI